MYETRDPRHYSLVLLQKVFQNTAPKIVTETLVFDEDELFEVDIETIDEENDYIEFALLVSPEHIQCNLTLKGKLICVPVEDFNGADSVTVEVKERGLPSYSDPNTVQRKIVVTVNSVPDKTERFFFDANDTFYEDKRPSMKHQLRLNANQSSFIFTGTIVLADVDENQYFTALPRFVPLVNSTYKLRKIDIGAIPLSNYTLRNYRSVEAYEVEFEFSPDISGNMTLDFIAQADDGSYTPGVTFEIFVLENPCVHGHCTHLLFGDGACDDIKRSKSFDGFVCVCDAGKFI